MPAGNGQLSSTQELAMCQGRELELHWLYVPSLAAGIQKVNYLWRHSQHAKQGRHFRALRAIAAIAGNRCDVRPRREMT